MQAPQSMLPAEAEGLDAKKMLQDKNLVKSLRYDSQFYKTKLCIFFQSGRCSRKFCKFAHGMEELQRAPDLRKTAMCKTFLTTQRCDIEDCSFAHSLDELRATDKFYKTTMCCFHHYGSCKLGELCRHAHSKEELRSLPDLPGLPESLACALLIEQSASKGARVPRTPGPQGSEEEQLQEIETLRRTVLEGKQQMRKLKGNDTRMAELQRREHQSLNRLQQLTELQTLQRFALQMNQNGQLDRSQQPQPQQTPSLGLLEQEMQEQMMLKRQQEMDQRNLQQQLQHQLQQLQASQAMQLPRMPVQNYETFGFSGMPNAFNTGAIDTSLMKMPIMQEGAASPLFDTSPTARMELNLFAPEVKEMESPFSQARVQKVNVNNLPTQASMEWSQPPFELQRNMQMQPAPMQPAQMQPAPMQPAPMQPAPMQPAPMQPAPMQPAPMQPAPMQPAPMQPAPMQPAPMQPAPMQQPMQHSPVHRSAGLLQQHLQPVQPQQAVQLQQPVQLQPARPVQQLPLQQTSQTLTNEQDRLQEQKELDLLQQQIRYHQHMQKQMELKMEERMRKLQDMEFQAPSEDEDDDDDDSLGPIPGLSREGSLREPLRKLPGLSPPKMLRLEEAQKPDDAELDEEEVPEDLGDDPKWERTRTMPASVTSKALAAKAAGDRSTPSVASTTDSDKTAPERIREEKGCEEDAAAEDLGPDPTWNRVNSTPAGSANYVAPQPMFQKGIGLSGAADDAFGPNRRCTTMEQVRGRAMAANMQQGVVPVMMLVPQGMMAPQQMSAGTPYLMSQQCQQPAVMPGSVVQQHPVVQPTGNAMHGNVQPQQDLRQMQAQVLQAAMPEIYED